MNGGRGIKYETTLRCMSLDLIEDKSTLVQVMAWCCQATSHYLSQCWLRSLPPYGVTRPQWVKKISIWVRSWRCSSPNASWFCCQLIAKPGNKTVPQPWPYPYLVSNTSILCPFNPLNTSLLSIVFRSTTLPLEITTTLLFLVTFWPWTHMNYQGFFGSCPFP